METFLRKTVPRAVLRKMALLANRLRVNTLDKILFSEAIIPQSEFVVYKEQLSLPELSNLNTISDRLVKKGLSVFTNLVDNEYILHYKGGCIIEPHRGWAIARHRQLIRFSQGAPEARHLKKPSLRYTGESRSRVHFNKVISLRDTSERAYFHFYSDLLSKFPLLQQYGIDVGNIPVIIGYKTYHQPFFQEMLLRSMFLAGINWYVQKDQAIYANEVIFCKPFSLQRSYMDWAAAQFHFPLTGNASNRIFLTRDRKRLRYIENMNELVPILQQYNFKIVDADRLPLSEQASLFSNAGYVVGIHGAGMTNMIFRKDKPLQLLEIFPPQKMIPYHYFILATRYGFQYHGMSGYTANSIKGSFKVDPATLEQELIKLVAG